MIRLSVTLNRVCLRLEPWYVRGAGRRVGSSHSSAARPRKNFSDFCFNATANPRLAPPAAARPRTGVPDRRDESTASRCTSKRYALACRRLSGAAFDADLAREPLCRTATSRSRCRQLKVKPRKTPHVQPCALELTNMLSCWASSGDLASSTACRDAAARLQECMRKPVRNWTPYRSLCWDPVSSSPRADVLSIRCIPDVLSSSNPRASLECRRSTTSSLGQTQSDEGMLPRSRSPLANPLSYPHCCNRVSLAPPAPHLRSQHPVPSSQSKQSLLPCSRSCSQRKLSLRVPPSYCSSRVNFTCAPCPPASEGTRVAMGNREWVRRRKPASTGFCPTESAFSPMTFQVFLKQAPPPDDRIAAVVIEERKGQSRVQARISAQGLRESGVLGFFGGAKALRQLKASRTAVCSICAASRRACEIISRCR